MSITYVLLSNHIIELIKPIKSQEESIKQFKKRFQGRIEIFYDLNNHKYDM